MQNENLAPTIEQLRESGQIIDRSPEMMAELYLFEGVEYVALPTNEVITRAEDNEMLPIFPY